MTIVEGVGLLLGIAGLAFAFEKPRVWFLRLFPFRRVVSPVRSEPSPPFLALNEKDKLVTSAWWEASDLRKEYESRGFKQFHWANAERVAEREQQGHEPVYLRESATNTNFRIVNKSGQVLMAKRDA